MQRFYFTFVVQQRTFLGLTKPGDCNYRRRPELRTVPLISNFPLYLLLVTEGHQNQMKYPTEKPAPSGTINWPSLVSHGISGTLMIIHKIMMSEVTVSSESQITEQSTVCDYVWSSQCQLASRSHSWDAAVDEQHHVDIDTHHEPMFQQQRLSVHEVQRWWSLTVNTHWSNYLPERSTTHH